MRSLFTTSSTGDCSTMSHTVRDDAAPRTQARRWRSASVWIGWAVLLQGIANLCLLDAAAAFQLQKGNAPAANVTGISPRKDAETFAKVRFSRQAEEAFRAIASKPAEFSDEPSRLAFWVQSGNWKEVRSFLTQFEPEGGRRIHSKMCSDLAYAQPKSMLLPLDVIALADASPVELDEKQVNLLGALLKVALRDSESRTELLAQLHRGTERLGGEDSHRRRMAARMLVAAELNAEAKTFGLPDRDLRPGVTDDRPSESVAPAAGRSVEQLLSALQEAKSDETARSAGLEELHQRLLAETAQPPEKLLRTILSRQTSREMAWLICGMIGQKTATVGRDVDFTTRTFHLELQRHAVDTIAQDRQSDEAWPAFANLCANNWLAEANHSVKVHPTWLKATTNRDKYPHVPIETVIQHAPSGIWLDTLQAPLNSMVRITLARLILLSSDIDRVLPHVRELVRTDGPAAAKLANAYLENWAVRHDPNLSADVLRQYRTDQQVIVLTRAQQEASLQQLGKLLASLDEPTRRLLDETQLVRAFDFCHSRAEIYTQAHLVDVFGPLDTISPSLILSLTERMRNKLALQWRDLAVQRDAATNRTTSDVFELVNQGYDEATRIAEHWLASHADAWQMNCLVGSLLSDWAEFAYFQSVVADDRGDRFSNYLKHSQQALVRFRAGAASYAAIVPKLSRKEFDLLPYRAWFNGLLGITHDGGVNLRKGVTRDGIEEVRKALLDLPAGASAAHIQMFSTMIADNIAANRIAPEMKYRYLSSAVHITGRQPTIYPAEEKIKYYDSLLKEIRLQTRLDGSERIHAPGVFGVFVSLWHTSAVARESGGFGKYLMNEVQRTVSGRTVVEKPQYRDRLEEALRVALADFFEIRAITFADPSGGARDIEPPPNSPSGVRWQETPLAYLLLATKDTTVDRIPSLEIELDFFDREGKVVIPVPSNPLLIELTPSAPVQRPADKISVTQIVDSRELADKRLKIDVIATAHGLVPELEQLLRLSDYSLAVQETSAKGELVVTELHNGTEGLFPVSERSWTIELDPSPLLRGASSRVDFEFPVAASKDVQMTYRRYQDLDPVDAAAKVTLIEGPEVAHVAEMDRRIGVGVAAGLLALGLLAFWMRRVKKPDASAVPPLFSLPREVTPFSVIALLHRIRLSPAAPLSEDQRRSLQSDIQVLEQTAFARDSTPTTSRDLETLARRWVQATLLHSGNGQ